MRKRPPQSLYEAMSPEELYRLVVAAHARGDEAESQEISSRVPRGFVRARHPGYTGPLEATRAMLELSVGDLGRYLGWLQVLDHLAGPMGAFMSALLGSPEPGEGEGQWLVIQGVLRRHALAELAARLEALRQAFAAQGLDWGEVLAAFCPDLAPELAAREEELAEASPDPAAVGVLREALEEEWKGVAGPVPPPSPPP